MWENTNPSSYIVCSKSEHTGHGGFIGFRQNDDLTPAYSQGHDNSLKGSGFPWVSKCGMLWEIQISICLWFFCFFLFFKENWSLLQITASGRMLPCSWATAFLSGKVYLKMNDRDRIVPSPWSSCFLIWDCNKTHIHVYVWLSNFKTTNSDFNKY